ncbi:N-alpha-acetyltransferase 38, NatC auxiliary subunit-like [Argopecten irradians]|uniref:N-alpha-acetyltransferase 38, NatC auxiliary subunit-like n=1 Tax=Argopecten irradians TaxID=31199 RepID=UPI0037123F9F
MAGEEPDAEKSEGTKKLERWLNKGMKIQMTDGRTLIGVFLCTDRDRNVILGSCEEYLRSPDSGKREDPRILGLAMIPGHHIVSIHIDEDQTAEQSVM